MLIQYKMSTIPTNLVVLDSRQRVSGTAGSAQYNLLPVTGAKGTYELLSFQSVNQFYTVEVGINDTIYWAEPGNLNATVPPGNYTVTTFNAAAKVVMDAASGSTFTFTVDADTGITTVAIAAGTFNWEWATNVAAGDSANELLGHSAVDTPAAASIAGNQVPNLRLHSCIVATLQQEGSRNVDLLSGVEASCIIPLESDFGDAINCRVFSQTFKFSSNISILNVDLATEDGTALVNAPEYVMLIRKLFE